MEFINITSYTFMETALSRCFGKKIYRTQTNVTKGYGCQKNLTVLEPGQFIIPKQRILFEAFPNSNSILLSGLLTARSPNPDINFFIVS